MGLKTFTINFSELRKDFFLRSDFDYFEIKKKLNLEKAPRLKKYLTFLETGKPITPKDYSEDETDNVHIVVRNIVDGNFEENNLIYITDEKAEELEKYRINNGDIIIAISSNCGFSFYYDGTDKRNLTLSHYLARFRVNQELINPIFINYYINSKILKQYFRSVETGKTLKNLSKYYIKELPVLIPNKKTQDQIVTKIEPIEKKIKELKAQIKPPQEVINKVFAREFGFDLETFEELKKIKYYYLDLSNFGNNKDIRQSVKFHRDAGYFVNRELNKITNKKIKDFIFESIVLGKGVSPSDYDDNGDYYYISMANIKNWQFESEDTKLVSNEYSDKNQNKTVSKNDILIARSGEGTIGKIALIDVEDIQGIFADFTMRIRLNNYNQLFAYYYFRTEYFQYLIEINKKGLGNNTNIFPSQIKEFPMIDISLKEQQKIVDEIKAELDKQEEMKQKIETERNKIDEIIEKPIK